jgi:signal transduction histidine kinase
MSTSISKQIALGGTAILGATLILVGVATAMVLHRRQTSALDEALLIAAHGRAHPEVDVEVEVEHSRAPIDAWIVVPGDGRVSASLARAALRGEAPLHVTVGDQRMVLLPFEVEGDEDEEREELAAAAAPVVTLARSVGPFAGVYALLAAMAALVATFVQLQVVRRAFEPVDRARERASRVTGFGADQRLDEDAPVEIQPLLVALNGLLERLDRSYRAQTRFTAEAAHELRTPVTAMLGELDVTLRSPRSAEAYQEVLTSMRDDVLRLRQLVEGLTALTRVDASDLGRSHELMRAGEVASNALAAEAATLRAAGNTVTVQLDDDPEIEANRSLVEAALGNLLRNAARHAPGRDVVLQVARRGDFAEFTVDDAGPGVEESERRCSSTASCAGDGRVSSIARASASASPSRARWLAATAETACSSARRSGGCGHASRCGSRRRSATSKAALIVLQSRRPKLGANQEEVPMNKHLALAYAFAGLAVAAALIAFVTTSTLTPDPAEVATGVAEAAAPDPGTPAAAPSEAPTATVAAAPAPEPAVEYVYVDEPARAGGRHDDDDDEDDEHEHDEHEDGDDDREERGGHHDDDD